VIPDRFGPRFQQLSKTSSFVRPKPRYIRERGYPCATASVYRWINEGRLPATPIGRRGSKRKVLLIRRSDIDTLVAFPPEPPLEVIWVDPDEDEEPFLDKETPRLAGNGVPPACDPTAVCVP
jgi:Helix-turn-helix domain